MKKKILNASGEKIAVVEPAIESGKYMISRRRKFGLMYVNLGRSFTAEEVDAIQNEMFVFSGVPIWEDWKKVLRVLKIK